MSMLVRIDKLQNYLYKFNEWPTYGIQKVQIDRPVKFWQILEWLIFKMVEPYH